MRWLHKLLRLTAPERYLLIRTAIVLNGIRLGLWLLPFQTLRSLLAKRFPVAAAPARPLSIEQIVWAIDLVSRTMPGDVKCLARALTAQAILAQQGYAAQLRLGVLKNSAGKLEAHAWIEHWNKVIIGTLPNLADFKPFPALDLKP